MGLTQKNKSLWVASIPHVVQKTQTRKMITKRRTSFTQTEKTILMTTESTIDCFKHKGPRKSNVCKSSVACSSWNMNSLREVLPESPSPICSTASTSPLSSPTCSRKADTFFTQLPIESSPTRRKQVFSQELTSLIFFGVWICRIMCVCFFYSWSWIDRIWNDIIRSRDNPLLWS